jgi:hypothetical protein
MAHAANRYILNLNARIGVRFIDNSYFRMYNLADLFLIEHAFSIKKAGLH